MSAQNGRWKDRMSQSDLDAVDRGIPPIAPRGKGSHETLRRREMDSNFQFLAARLSTVMGDGPAVPRSEQICCGTEGSNPSPSTGAPAAERTSLSLRKRTEPLVRVPAMRSSARAAAPSGGADHKRRGATRRGDFLSGMPGRLAPWPAGRECRQEWRPEPAPGGRENTAEGSSSAYPRTSLGGAVGTAA